MKEKERIKAKLTQYKTDPVAFVVEVLGVQPDKWQAEALRSVLTYDRISIRSGHGVGKSAFLSFITLWWLCTRSGDGCKVAMTAPTSHQLHDVLFSSIAQWYRKMPTWYQKQLSIKSERVEVVGKEQECFAVARTSRKENPEALQGFHSENMLFVVDEASGVEPMVFETAQGSMSSKGAKTIMCGNPTRQSGYFYDSFHSHRDKWKTFKVSCADSKNVDPSFIEEMASKYGEESSVFKVRVLGDFDNEQGDTVIPLNIRDELWFKAREWFDSRDCKIPEGCDELVAELSVPTYQFTSVGKIQVESKDSLKKRGVRSPDLADSFCLTMAHERVFSGGYGFKTELPELEVAIV